MHFNNTKYNNKYKNKYKMLIINKKKCVLYEIKNGITFVSSPTLTKFL